MISRIYHISHNTFRECIRQPIYALLMLTSLGIIGNHPPMALYVFREQEKLVTDGSLATVMMFGWITAVLCASHAIAREIDTGTVLLILSKPVNRATFVVAKILGILAALTLFVWVNGICVLLAIRTATDQFRFDPGIYSMIFGAMALACIIGAIANYVRQSSFAAVVAISLGIMFTILLVVVFFLPPYDMGYKWGQHVGYDSDVIKAILLVLFSVWAMGTLATALSTHFGLVSNLTICAVIFTLGLVSDYTFSSEGLLQTLSWDDLARMVHAWHLALLPFVLFCWALAMVHFPGRKNTRVKAWELHTGFGLVSISLLARAAYIITNRLYLADPSATLTKVVDIIFATKNGLAEVLHAVIPNWQLFWMADALAAHKPIPAGYLMYGLVYIIIFIAIFALLAYGMFINREVGKQSLR